jgi:DNA invertase Pin-like site-specific DNA recombinase
LNIQRKIRCAIYTRKSSEEGLELDFNSLHAQREACASYVQSQRHEGWKLLPTLYDDGGYSGGTLERPALQQLLADIRAGAVELIVVYKIDRLTRSLNDFAKIVELLDKQGASFVSVTQSFNTTTSMGRLTLNVLLSFAQFEREVTGERIRDKIAASKKKGMWMGGLVPIGYDSVDRKLVVNAEEAETVRRIFERYRTFGDVAKVRRSLESNGLASKARYDRKGRCWAGTAFSNGALFTILDNRIYRGEIVHKGRAYPGRHEAIVSQDLWDAVQAVRERNRRRNTATPRAQGKNPLLGLLADEMGRAYQGVFTTKGGKRYRYYVSRMPAHHKEECERATVRLPADELEQHVAERICALFGSPQALGDALMDAGDDLPTRQRLIREGNMRAESMSDPRSFLMHMRAIIRRVVLRTKTIEVEIDRAAVRLLLLGEGERSVESEESSIPVVLGISSHLHRTGHDLRMVIAEGEIPHSGRRDIKLIRLIARGRRWFGQVTSGEMPSLSAIARAEGLSNAYAARIFAGALLAPDIVETVLAGQQPITFTAYSLRIPPPLDWAEQRRKFGFPAV